MGNFNVGYQSATNNAAANFAEQMSLSRQGINDRIETAYFKKRVFAERGLIIPIKEGYGEKFPAMWSPSVKYHTPGTRELGDTHPTKNQRVINADDRQVSVLFQDELDVRRGVIPFIDYYGASMGEALADAEDVKCGIGAILAARGTAVVTGASAGQESFHADIETSADAAEAVLYDAKNKLDLYNVPSGQRCAVITPTMFNKLLSRYQSLSKNMALPLGGSMNMIPNLAGFEEIIMSNNIPSTNIASATTGQQNTYTGNFTTTRGVAFHKGAYGTVYYPGINRGAGREDAGQHGTMSPLDVRMVEEPSGFGFLFIASIVTGTSILDPMKACELGTAART